jgi:hypothetical protein
MVRRDSPVLRGYFSIANQLEQWCVHWQLIQLQPNRILKLRLTEFKLLLPQCLSQGCLYYVLKQTTSLPPEYGPMSLGKENAK